jgi:hypothetical protein
MFSVADPGAVACNASIYLCFIDNGSGESERYGYRRLEMEQKLLADVWDCSFVRRRRSLLRKILCAGKCVRVSLTDRSECFVIRNHCFH